MLGGHGKDWVVSGARRVDLEILDRLPADDPEALRSRRDLRRINALMGNVRWVERVVRRFPQDWPLAEIGAGEGVLCRRLAVGGGRRVIGLDLAPPPVDCPGVDWRQGDLFGNLPDVDAGILLGVMIVHHFSVAQLAELGRLAGRFRGVCFCEPWRAALPEVWGRLMWPVVGRVTRHDLRVSQRAGFRPGELAGLLGVADWRIEESVDWRGSLRFVAWRN